MADIAKSRQAAAYAAAHQVSLAEAARKFGCTTQAASAAWKRMTSEPRRPGRRPSGNRRTESISLRLGGAVVTVDVTAEERKQFECAAGEAGIGPWMRGLLTEHPAGRRKLRTHLRKIARAAAGMPEE